MAELSEQQKDLKEGWECAKDLRRPREAKWQEVADFCDLTSDIVDDQGTVMVQGGPMIERKVFTGAGILYSKRCAALVTAYTINPVRPFVNASLELPVDMSAGFVTQNSLGTPSQEYLSGFTWQYFAEQMRARSNFMLAAASSNRDFTNYGPGIRYTSLNERGAARWKHCTVRNCWLRVNEDGEVDTLYRRAWFRLDRLIKVYPAAQGHEKIRKLAESKKAGRTLVQVVHVCQPREGGVFGAVKVAKPVASVFFLPEYDCHIVAEEGFDSFPYSVSCNDATEDNPYGVGIAEAALPDLKALNHYIAGLEDNLDLINEPPALYKEGLFKKFSFDAASLTAVDSFSAFGDLRESFYQLPVAGQVGPVMGYADRMELRVGEHFYSDWMKLRESGTMTATEVNDRRDLRIRSLSSLVPALGPEFGAEADRIMELKQARRQVPPPPQELADKDIGWEYAGPLMDAMKATQGDSLGRVFALWQGLIKESPEIADIIDMEAVIRNWGDAQGLEPGNLRSKEAVAKLGAERQKRADAQAMQESVTAGATGFRDAAQGIASLANAGNPQAMQLAGQLEG